MQKLEDAGPAAAETRGMLVECRALLGCKLGWASSYAWWLR